MILDIPGRSRLTLRAVVVDFNGTLAERGEVTPNVARLFEQVCTRYSVYLVTADTFGTARAFAHGRKLSLKVVESGIAKAELVDRLGDGVVAVGNGVNDEPMFLKASLSIAVLGAEGTALRAIWAADLVVPNVTDAFDLLLDPKALTATLRE